MEKETHVYKSVGALEIKADLYRAAGAGSRPVIVWIHGGALMSGSRLGVREPQLERYLESGWSVVSIDYRLAPETKIDGIIGDLKDAFAWVGGDGGRLLGVDPTRLAVVGHSAGGYLTLMAGFAVRLVPSALVSFYGYGDIAADWYARPDPFYCSQGAIPEAEARSQVGAEAVCEPVPGKNRLHFYHYCRQHGLWPLEVTGHDPVSEPGFFDAYCPVRNVSAGHPPTMLLHGDADTDVPFEQSVAMAEELARHGVPHEMIAIPGGPHGFDGAYEGADATPVADAFERVLDFLRSHLDR